MRFKKRIFKFSKFLLDLFYDHIFYTLLYLLYLLFSTISISHHRSFGTPKILNLHKNINQIFSGAKARSEPVMKK